LYRDMDPSMETVVYMKGLNPCEEE
jgi:hypothetical protein